MTARQLFRLKCAVADMFLTVDDLLKVETAETILAMRTEGVDPEVLTARIKAEFERVFAEAPK